MNISMYRDLLDLRNLGTVYKTQKITIVPVFRTSLTHMSPKINAKIWVRVLESV